MKKIYITLFYLLLISNISQAVEKIKPIIEGNLEAKINIVVYESLTCSHCANFHKDVYPLLKENFIDNGLASIEFRSFPLDIAALNASKLAHCKNDGNSDVLHFLYKNQNKWVRGSTIDDLNKNLEKLLESSNFNLDMKKCINDRKIEDYILEDRIKGVKTFKIESTPTVIILDEKFEKPLTYKNLKKYLEKLI